MSKKLSEFLKSARLDAGLIQGEVAKHLGYSSAQFVSNWERGLVTPPLGSLGIIMKLYKVKPDILINLMLSEYESELRHAIEPKKKSKK